MIKNKVKIFRAFNEDELENRVNDWLARCDNDKVNETCVESTQLTVIPLNASHPKSYILIALIHYTEESNTERFA
jgi:hypothetical protein